MVSGVSLSDKAVCGASNVDSIVIDFSGHHINQASVDSFCANLFVGFTNLKKVSLVLPSSVTTMGNYAFGHAFSGLTNLQEVSVVVSGFTTFGSHVCDSMFMGCTSLTSINCDLSGVGTIGTYAFGSMFSGCSSLVCTTDSSTIGTPKFSINCHDNAATN